MFSQRKVWIGVLGVLLAISLTSNASAGCKITISVNNTGTAALTVDWDESKVKTKGGLWKKIKGGKNTVAPGATESHVYTATFNCDANRRYQIFTEQGDSDQTTYIPSSSTWTTDSSPTVSISYP